MVSAGVVRGIEVVVTKPLLEVGVIEVLLNPGDIGMVPIVVLLTVKVVPCPLTKLVRVMIVQGFDFDFEHVDKLELPLEMVEIVAAAALTAEEPVGASSEIVLVIETGASEELTPGVGSARGMLVLSIDGSLCTVCVRVTGSPVRAVDCPSAGTTADG